MSLIRCEDSTTLTCCSATPLLRRAVADYNSGAATNREDLRWGAHAGVASVRVWDWESGVAAAARQAKIAREQGSLITLPIALNVQAEVLCLGGDLRSAALLAAEADRGRVAQPRGLPRP
jgi:hypothetical protein